MTVKAPLKDTHNSGDKSDDEADQIIQLGNVSTLSSTEFHTDNTLGRT